MRDLKSSVSKYGETVTQIIHFSHGNKRTFNGIITKSIKQGEFTKMDLLDGRGLSINTANVDCIEIFPEDYLPLAQEQIYDKYQNIKQGGGQGRAEKISIK